MAIAIRCGIASGLVGIGLNRQGLARVRAVAVGGMMSGGNAVRVTMNLAKTASTIVATIASGVPLRSARVWNWLTIAVLAALAANRAIGQQVGDRLGDTCRLISIDERTELFLYQRPLLDAPPPDVGGNTVSRRQTIDFDERPDENRIVQLFDRERIAALDFNRGGVDGDPNVWHEIEDSIGNRGYMLAIDPAIGLSTLIDCE